MIKTTTVISAAALLLWACAATVVAHRHGRALKVARYGVAALREQVRAANQESAEALLESTLVAADATNALAKITASLAELSDCRDAMQKEVEALEAENRSLRSQLAGATASQPEQAGRAVILDAQRLAVGSSYIVSRATPLMPSDNFDGAIAAGMIILEIPPSGAFKILATKKRGPTPWYRVAAADDQRQSLGQGWINSIALIGQDLKPAE